MQGASVESGVWGPVRRMGGLFGSFLRKKGVTVGGTGNVALCQGLVRATWRDFGCGRLVSRTSNHAGCLLVHPFLPITLHLRPCENRSHSSRFSTFLILHFLCLFSMILKMFMLNCKYKIFLIFYN